MRPYCLECTIKHLGQAYVNHHGEGHLGYPQHFLAVIGHLAEAAEECVAASPELADEIRSHRRALHKDIIDIVANKKDVDIPYFDLFFKTLELMKEKGCGNCDGASEKLQKLVELRKNQEKK